MGKKTGLHYKEGTMLTSCLLGNLEGTDTRVETFVARTEVPI